MNRKHHHQKFRNPFQRFLSELVTGSLKKYQSDETIFRQGDPARAIFWVEKGQVRLDRDTVEGRTVPIYLAAAGESFAEAALFSSVYHCNAFTTAPSRVIHFPKNEVISVLEKNPDKALEYIALLSGQVRDLRTRLELRNILSARERIHQFLLLHSDPETRLFIVPDTLKEVAGRLGLSHEAFYRELKKLENDAVIRRSGNRIKLADFPPYD